MTKQRAIYQKCLECSGSSPKEVTLCILLDCPLWEYRCGYHISSTRYLKRIESAFIKYKNDALALAKVEGLTKDDYLKKHKPAMHGARKKG